MFLTVLFWVTPWALADNTAQVLNGPEASAAPDPGYYARECARVYKEANCADFFKENPELGKYAIDCNKPISPETELKKCGAGAWEGATELAHFIAGAVAGISSI